MNLRTAFIRIAHENPETRSTLLPLVKQADKWEKMPKGWTDESRKEFWETLTGDVKHKVTKCIKEMEGKFDDPGAFCASLADRVDPGWRSRTAMEHSSPEALKQYLKEHPNADPKNHTVKTEGGNKGNEARNKTEVLKELDAVKKDFEKAEKTYQINKKTISSLGESLKKIERTHGASDPRLNSIKSKMNELSAQGGQYLKLKKQKEQLQKEFSDSFESELKNEKQASLRARAIRLAHARPELRAALLPLLKESSSKETIAWRPAKNEDEAEWQEMMDRKALKGTLSESDRKKVESKGGKFKT